MIKNWIHYKIKSYNRHLLKKTKQELWRLLMYKMDDNRLTDNEHEIMLKLFEEDDVQEMLDPGYTKGVDRLENKDE